MSVPGRRPSPRLLTLVIAVAALAVPLLAGCSTGPTDPAEAAGTTEYVTF